MKHITKKQALLGVFSFFMVGTLSFLMTSNMKKSDATMAGFSAGNIISDYVMGNYNSMNESQIQAFLKSKNSCNDTGTYKAQQYPNYSYHIVNGHFVCMADENFNGESAAHIIYRAAQDYRINPQVLIVLLQKEQGLVTDTWPNSVQYRSATGYGCPDTAACDSQYYGLKNQIRNAAELYRWILDHGSKYYPVGWNNVRFSPNAACGSSRVNIENNATAALYQYTPYQPNAAAINAGYGTGDACSAYGNRNFYNYFTDWFGDTRSTGVIGEQTSFMDGTYVLSIKTNQGKKIDVYNANTENNTNIQLWERTNGNNQKWTIRNTGGGYYTMMDNNSGKYLDLHGASTDNGTNVSLWEYTGSCAQKWKPILTPDSYITFISACSNNKALNLEDSQLNNGANINLWQVNNSDTQKWRLIPIQSIPDGIYQFNSATHRGKSLDVVGNGTTNGTNINLWSRNGGTSQDWQVHYEPDSEYYVLTRPHSSKNLDLFGAIPNDGANIDIWNKNNSCSQRWGIVEINGQYTFSSACNVTKMIDINGGVPNNGANIQLWENHYGLNQRWEISPQNKPQNGYYVLTSAADRNKAFDVYDKQTQNGANIQLWEKHGGYNQQWEVRRLSNGFFTFSDRNSGRRLDLFGAIPLNSANINIWSSNNSCAQQWDLLANTDGSYIIVSACNNNMAIDIFNANTSNGSNIQIWDSHFGLNQSWYFERI